MNESPYRFIEETLLASRTRYPFRATINGEPVIVWPDWIERDDSDDDPYDVPWEVEEE
jgi:hypothetical protein